MPKLYNVGWDNSADQIETSIKDFLENAKIEPKKGESDYYITFDNISFERKKDAWMSTNIKDAIINQML